jgi:UDP:flavonoid glycosyltransferase YjiC (YdhE family)
VRVLFVSVSSPGFLFPAVGLARALRGRGHAVAFVAGPESGELLAAQGIPRVAGGADPVPFAVNKWGLTATVVDQVAHIEAGVRGFAPDVLVGQQMTLASLVVRRRLGIPTVQLGLATYLLPVAPTEDPTPRERRRIFRHREMRRVLAEARTQLGLGDGPPDDPCDSELLGDRFLLPTVAELEGDVAGLPPRVRLTGSLLWEPDGHDPELDEFLAGGGDPVLYVQPGRAFREAQFWPIAVEALGGRPVRVVADVGRLERCYRFPVALPSFLVRTFVPQGQVLGRARAAVSSGHTTSVVGALVHGLPSLLFPTVSGTDDLAELCVERGVAIARPPAALDVATLRAAVDEILDDGPLRARAGELAAAFARIDGPARAAALIEDATAS